MIYEPYSVSSATVVAERLSETDEEKYITDKTPSEEEILKRIKRSFT